MDESGFAGGASRAEQVFADFLASQDPAAALGESFEELCRNAPELESELRALRDDWSLLAGVRRRQQRAPEPGDERLRSLWQELTRPRSFRERFRYEALLGQGGQGAVSQALDVTLGRDVAIKSLREGDSIEGDLDEARLARFLAEAQITAQLDHPGIVALHELGLDENERPYFTMTRVNGEELGRLFEDARGDTALRLRCVAHLLRVCETLAFAHSRGVVHRDVKPANIMVGSFGEVFVMDWGLARVMREAGEHEAREESSEAVRTVRDQRQGVASALDTEPLGRIGTLWYMAPESARQGVVGAHPAIDVYGVGALLYELLNGAPPYARESRGEAMEEVLQRIAREAPRSLAGQDGVAPELVSIVERAMARDRSERYPSMSALGEDLRAYLEDRVVRAHASGPWAELRKWVRRNRRLAGALGVLALSIFAAAWIIAALQVRSRASLDREADLYRLPYLEQRARELWPESPSKLAAFDTWLAAAERLVSRRSQHLEEWEALTTRPPGSATPGATESQRRATLERTLAGIDRMADAQDGLLPALRRRRAWAAGVRALTLEEPAEEWRAACERIARDEGPYLGMAWRPVLGLVPLGRDRESGLEEFAFPRSGSVPQRGEDGRLELSAQTGLVFVLVPAGSFFMGAQREDSLLEGFDPGARPEEGPVHEVQLDAFLISKYELTQGQWSRLGGGTPSFVRAEAEGPQPDRHPVEGISWNTARALLRRFELDLPSEAQWEYAARAGTEGPFLGSRDGRTLVGSVNLADGTVLEAGLGWPQARGMDWLRDGYLRHAPVGSFAANDFGLHDVLGNVWEWCRDAPASYEVPVLPGHGERRPQGTTRERVARGGGYLNNAAFARVSLRDMGRSSDFDSAYHGVRPIWARSAPEE